MQGQKTALDITNPKEWAFDYDIFFFIEVPTATIKDKLPRLIKPVEPRPGVSLIGFGLHRFVPGNLNGKLPALAEVNCSVLVQPNLSVKMPIPRFSFYVLYLASSCDDFMEYATTVDKMPAYCSSNLQCIISDDGTEVTCKDDNGIMFELKNTLPQPKYTPDTISGQAFTCANGEDLYCTPFKWRGTLCEHQHSSKNFGKVYNHPSLEGISLSENNQECNFQMFTQNGDEGKGALTYWDPILMYASKKAKS